MLTGTWELDLQEVLTGPPPQSIGAVYAQRYCCSHCRLQSAASLAQYL